MHVALQQVVVSRWDTRTNDRKLCNCYLYMLNHTISAINEDSDRQKKNAIFCRPDSLAKMLYGFVIRLV